MARKSGWQQFADNFTSTYGAVNKFSEEGAIRDINERSLEEQFDDTGAVTGYKYGDTLYNTMDDKGGLMRPTDTQLQSQNFKDTQKAMSRHGNWKEAQEMGLGRAKLESQEEATRLARDTHDFNVKEAEARAKQANVTISQAQLNENKNQILLDYSSKVGSEEWVKNPGEGKKFLLEAAFKTGDQQFYTMISSMDESAINQKLNGAAQLMAGAKAALSKGQAGGQEELMALIDAQDGIKGNIKFITDKKSGAVSIVELDQEGNPTNAAPWAGKNWEDFSQNVMKRLDPLTALSITAKQQGVAETTAKIGLINAQTLEALQKASGSGDAEGLNKIKQKAVTDFMNNEAGLYQQALRKGNTTKAKSLLGVFKQEMQRALGGSYNQQKPAPAPSAGGDVLNLTNELTRTADGTPVGGGGTPTPTPTPVPVPTPAPPGDGGLKWTRDQSAAGNSGFTKQQVDKTASLNTQAKQKQTANAEIGKRVYRISRILGKDLIPNTLDSNLSAADYKAQKLRDATIKWLDKNDQYFLRKENISKLAAFEKNPEAWYQKNIKAPKDKKGLKK